MGLGKWYSTSSIPNTHLQVGANMINCYSGSCNYKGIAVPEGEEMTDEISHNAIKEKIRTWLMEDGWSLRIEPSKDAIWAFVAEDGGKRKIVVGQTVGREDNVIIQAAVDVDDEIRNKLAQLPEDERNNFLWDLRFELIRTNLEFSGIQIPLKRIEVIERLFLDALTKDAFLQKASEVRKGVLIVLWMVARKFAQKPQQRQLGFKT